MKCYRCGWSFYRTHYNALCFSYVCFEFMMNESHYLPSFIEICAKGHACDCTPQANRSENWLILTLETNGQRARGRVVLLISSVPLIPLNRNFMTSSTSHWTYLVRFWRENICSTALLDEVPSILFILIKKTAIKRKFQKSLSYPEVNNFKILQILWLWRFYNFYRN